MKLLKELGIPVAMKLNVCSNWDNVSLVRINWSSFTAPVAMWKLSMAVENPQDSPKIRKLGNLYESIW